MKAVDKMRPQAAAVWRSGEPYAYHTLLLTQTVCVHGTKRNLRLSCFCYCAGGAGCMVCSRYCSLRVVCEWNRHLPPVYRVTSSSERDMTSNNEIICFGEVIQTNLRCVHDAMRWTATMMLSTRHNLPLGSFCTLTNHNSFFIL
jgi:hypothetical protein